MDKLNSLDELFLKKLTVLYVEDHADTREELTELLESIFPKVLVATNGYEGLECYKNNPIDLIITDINMPIMDGISMIEAIRKDDQEIKIVVFSAHEKIEYLSRCIELDVDGFLTKPLNQKKYFQTLYKVVEQIQMKKELLDYKSNLEKKVQEQLNEIVVKNDILEKNSRLATMGEMIDIIGHQWKSPLNVISMYIESAKMKIKLEKMDNKELLNYFGKMSFQIQHLFETINEFRKFFRPNTNLENSSVKSLIESTLLLLKDELIRCTINTECNYEDDLHIMVNPNEFKHVLINLIQNSKEAFVQNDISGRTISFDIVKKEDKVEIRICDNAGGISKDKIDKVFTAHFTTKEEFDGTGIGLYLSKQILDKIDAKIRVENIDNGSCFIIVI